MFQLDLYFEIDVIVKVLCKYRAKLANKRHSKHILNNYKDVRKNINVSNEEDIFIMSLFPNRRKWKKLCERDRKKTINSVDLNNKRLLKSYQAEKNLISETYRGADWYISLINFAEEIKNAALNSNSEYVIMTPLIRGIKKKEKDDVVIYRPIALYKLKDQIICSLVAKYYRTVFELLFEKYNCSYAFRVKGKNKKVPNHHDCIDRIIEYKKANSKVWVSECDIQKFFDTVQHEYLLMVFRSSISEVEAISGSKFSQRAIELFELFLDSFSFKENILSLDEEWFKANKLKFGFFEWAEDELNESFGTNYVNNNRIGVPQGNAISCFVSNLLLHNVDKVICEFDDELFYIRYCDDMILMHPDKEKCNSALDLYMEAIKKQFLLYHEPFQIKNYHIKQNAIKFWKKKSKRPFNWDNKKADKINGACYKYNVPWVSFVGYQIDYNLRIRVRHSTIKKETKKQVAEVDKLAKLLNKNVTTSKGTRSRLSQKQIVYRLNQKLINMSVGRINLRNHKVPSQQGMCWTKGFEKVNDNLISRKQFKYLDKKRQIQIVKLKAVITKLKVQKSRKLNAKEILELKKLEKIKHHSAFSYYNYLKYK